MKLQAQSSRALYAALNKSIKCIGSRNTIAILDHILITQKDDRFFFVSSTTEARLTIPAPLTLVGGKYEGPVCVPYKELVPLLSSLSDCVVTFTFNDKKILTMEYSTETRSGKCDVPCFDGKEYPNMVDLDEEKTMHLSLPLTLFQSVVTDASRFILANELRPVMACLLLDVSEDRSRINFVGANDKTMFKCSHSNDPAHGGSNFYRGGEPRPLLVRLSYFKVLSVLGDDGDVSISTDGDMMNFTSDDIEIRCRCTEGLFPNYAAVIPTKNPYYVCLNKKELINTIRRVGIFASTESNLVVIKKEGAFLNLSARDVDFARAAEDQVTLLSGDCPDSFQIGTKASEICNCLQTIPSDTVRIALSDPSRAMVITADDPAPSIMTLCMPMLIND